ncbi:MAG TPA: hypothetical protein VNK24_08180 [Elusimicrobiota bacterium]|nr:hypothetical protein [Elusimicrobiota bacterium]
MNGYIGYFDILGYRSFLENNPQEGVQKRVLGLIADVKKSLPEAMKKYRSKLSEAAEEIIGKTNWLVFSDTIVFAIEEPDNKKDELLYFPIAIITAGDLMTRMFNDGLPLRGALHHGQYNFLENSMAGTGVVQSINAGKDLDLSACVLTEELAKRAGELIEATQPDEADRNFWDQILCDYSVPISGDKWAKRKCLMWFDLNHIENLRGDGIMQALSRLDYRQYVLLSFWAHNKGISDTKTVRKLDETERFIRYCVFRRDENQRANHRSKP